MKVVLCLGLVILSISACGGNRSSGDNGSNINSAVFEQTGSLYGSEASSFIGAMIEGGAQAVVGEGSETYSADFINCRTLNYNNSPKNFCWVTIAGSRMNLSEATSDTILYILYRHDATVSNGPFSTNNYEARGVTCIAGASESCTFFHD
ncbi:MAG: hypothetical protein HQK54_17420 [Oligoflexales bacterium]|nr:hypothetical protein [Oligoflexales bacterium]